MVVDARRVKLAQIKDYEGGWQGRVYGGERLGSDRRTRRAILEQQEGRRRNADDRIERS